MKSTENRPSRIVILGGGYVAVQAYRSLIRGISTRLKHRAVEITVVCPMRSHVFHGWTAEVLEGIIPPSHRLSPLASIFK